jgi:hypothetical protein
MSVQDECRVLRERLAAWAAEPDPGLDRYGGRVAAPRGLWRQLRRRVGDTLRWLGVYPPLPDQRWRPALRHYPAPDEARPLLIWAVGEAPDDVKAACERLQERLDGDTRWAPVLVTDHAAFAFYSRLGWLVEFLPALGSDAEQYAARKTRHLAWRYQQAPAVPLSAAGLDAGQWQALLADQCS